MDAISLQAFVWEELGLGQEPTRAQLFCRRGGGVCSPWEMNMELVVAAPQRPNGRKVRAPLGVQQVRLREKRTI